MAAGSIEEILGARNLIGMIQSVVGGVPADIMPPEFYKASRTCEGNRGTYFKVRGTRQTARIVQYGGASKARELPGVSEEPVTLLHTFEHIIHQPSLLQNLLAEDQRDPSAEVKQKLGLQTVSRQIATFGDLFKNLRVSAIYSALAKGAIYWDANGNLLATSAGAFTTVDYSVPSGNKDQLNVFGAGNIIGTSWDDPTADINVQCRNIIKAGRKLTGYVPTHAFYGANVPGYIASNNTVKQILTGSARYAEATATTEIPDGTFGIKKWIPIAEAFFAKGADGIALGDDETSSYADWFSDDQVVFTPDASPDWWEVLEGTYPVPRAFTITKDTMQQIQSLQQIAGPFSYAVIQDDPVTIKQLAGDTFLPIIKVPGAIFNATVKFT